MSLWLQAALGGVAITWVILSVYAYREGKRHGREQASDEIFWQGFSAGYQHSRRPRAQDYSRN